MPFIPENVVDQLRVGGVSHDAGRETMTGKPGVTHLGLASARQHPKFGSRGTRKLSKLGRLIDGRRLAKLLAETRPTLPADEPDVRER